MLAIMVAEYTYESLNIRSCTKECSTLITLSERLFDLNFSNLYQTTNMLTKEKVIQVTEHLYL